MTPKEGVDLAVIGRSPKAFALEPERLRATEGVVNHTMSLLMDSGTAEGEPWDFMIAMRLMTRACAALIVEHSTEESIANDVAWPLLARQHEMAIGYIPVNGLA